MDPNELVDEIIGIQGEPYLCVGIDEINQKALLHKFTLTERVYVQFELLSATPFLGVKPGVWFRHLYERVSN